MVLAIPTLQFQHNQTQPGETILATISTTGEFTKQIEPSDINFYEGRKQISLESDITFYEGNHYLYIYTTRKGNFSIQIKNVLYKEVDMLQSTTISKEFSVSRDTIINEETNETSTEILTIKPGFILTTLTPSIKFINSGSSVLNLTYNENETSLNPLESQTITFTPTQTFSTLNISTYKEFSIPIIYLAENATFKSPIIKSELRQNPELFFSETFTETSTQGIIELFNFGDNNITNLQLTSNVDFIKAEELEDMLPRGIQNLTLTLNPKVPGHFQGTINITFTQNETEDILEIPLSIFVLPQGTPTESFQIKNETCKELSGTVCPSETLCNGTATFTKSINPEYCCLGSCVETKDKDSESNGFGWLVGIVILIILALIGYYFYKKQKQITPQAPQEQLKIKTEKYNKRMTGTLTKS